MNNQKLFYINTVCSTNQNINDKDLLKILYKENNKCRLEHNHKLNNNKVVNYKQKNNVRLNDNYIRNSEGISGKIFFCEISGIWRLLSEINFVLNHRKNAWEIRKHFAEIRGFGLVL